MKKIIFSLGTLLLCLVLAGCSGSGASYFKSLAKDIEKNGDEWDIEKWTSVMKEAAEKELAFWESDPSEKEVDEFDEAQEECGDAIRDLKSKAQSKARKASNKKEVEKILEKSNKAEKKVRKKINKENGDDDEDDDY